MRSVCAAGVPGGQGPVPHHPHAAERAVQHRLLLLVRVRPAPVRRPHPRRIAHLIEELREPRHTGGYHFLSRYAGHPAGGVRNPV